MSGPTLPTRAFISPDDKNVNNAAALKNSESMHEFDGVSPSLLSDCVEKDINILAQYTEQECAGGENQVCENMRDKLNGGLEGIADDSRCEHRLQTASLAGTDSKRGQQNMRTHGEIKKMIIGGLQSPPCRKVNNIFRSTLQSLVDLVPRFFSTLKLCPSLYQTNAKASDVFIYLLLMSPIYQPWHHSNSHGTVFFEDLLLALSTGFIQASFEKNHAALSSGAMKSAEKVSNIVTALKRKVASKSGSGTSSTN